MTSAMKKTIPKIKELTEFQKAMKEIYTPKPPEGLSPAASRLFKSAVKKIQFIPLESGGMDISYKVLSEEECFAIGVSLFTPKVVREKEKSMLRRTALGRFPAAPNSDLAHAIDAIHESERKTILVTQHGESFPTGRLEGAISDVTKHIRELVTNSPNSTAKELERIAEKEIIDGLSSRRFANAVSEARKELNLPKPKKTAKPTSQK